MLAGVGGVDACLFVVAATEGWKPQSEEHLRILELVGLGHGIIALTKVDLVDDEWRELQELDIRDRLAGSFLADAPIVPVSATTGSGSRRAARRARRARAPDARPRSTASDRGCGSTACSPPRAAAPWSPARSPAARCTSTNRCDAAAGTMSASAPCSRTVAASSRSARQPRRAEPRRRRSHRARTRRRRDRCRRSGGRRSGSTPRSTCCRPSHHDVSRRGAYLAYIGSGEFPVKLRVLGRDAIPPGGDGLVRLHLARPLPLLPGDRFVLRESGRDETVGGGEVLDVAPVLPASKARPDRSVDRVIAERGWIDCRRSRGLDRRTARADARSWRRLAGVAASDAATTSGRASRQPATSGSTSPSSTIADARSSSTSLDGVAVEAGTGPAGGHARPARRPSLRRRAARRRRHAAGPGRCRQGRSCAN